MANPHWRPYRQGMKTLNVVLIVALAILAVDAVFELLARDYWGAARTLAIVVLVPFALRTNKTGGTRE